MRHDEVAKAVLATSGVTREDIARAKAFALRAGGGSTPDLADQWLRDQGQADVRSIDPDSPNAAEAIPAIARAISLRLAFCQAVCELVASGELIAAAAPRLWEARLEWRSRNGGGAIDLAPRPRCWFPEATDRPPLEPNPPADLDVFLRDLDWRALHAGIQEAINQALGCFRRGLYLPAIAMLAAAAEATWHECGAAIAAKLSNAKLGATVADPLTGTGRKVAEVRKAMQCADGNTLLKAAGVSHGKWDEAEVWTTTVRENRNALHWDAGKGFILSHSDAANLLMAAPIHVGTLEAIRAKC